MAQGAAQRVDPRLVAGGPQPPGVERRQGPVLAPGVEAIRRGADPHLRDEGVLPQPGVGTARIDADGQVGHDRKARPRAASCRSSSHCSQA